MYNVHNHIKELNEKMGYRHRNMYKLTGLPGWMRFGYSPGWVDRSPTGLPPTAQWLIQSGHLQKYTQWLKTQTVPTTTQSTVTPVTAYTKEQEKQMLEQQVQIMKEQLQSIRNRLEELSKQREVNSSV
jgi:hypothetical protein